jgi:hypothetical protein
MLRHARGCRPRLNRRPRKSGAAAVEFALVLPLFTLLLMAMIEFGRVFWFQVSLRYAVEQTARYAMAEYTRESFSGAGFLAWFNSWEPELEARASQDIYGWDPSAAVFTATVEPAASADDVDYVTIAASYKFEFLFPVIPGGGARMLTATARTPLVGWKNSATP